MKNFNENYNKTILSGITGAGAADVKLRYVFEANKHNKDMNFIYINTKHIIEDYFYLKDIFKIEKMEYIYFDDNTSSTNDEYNKFKNTINPQHLFLNIFKTNNLSKEKKESYIKHLIQTIYFEITGTEIKNNFEFKNINKVDDVFNIFNNLFKDNDDALTKFNLIKENLFNEKEELKDNVKDLTEIVNHKIIYIALYFKNKEYENIIQNITIKLLDFILSLNNDKKNTIVTNSEQEINVQAKNYYFLNRVKNINKETIIPEKDRVIIMNIMGSPEIEMIKKETGYDCSQFKAGEAVEITKHGIIKESMDFYPIK